MPLLPHNTMSLLSRLRPSGCVAGVDLGAHAAKIVLARPREGRSEIVAAVRLCFPAELPAELGPRVEYLGSFLKQWCGATIDRGCCSLPPWVTDYESAALPPDFEGEAEELAAARVIRQLIGSDDLITWDYWKTAAQEIGDQHDSLHVVWAANQDVDAVLAGLAQAGVRCGVLGSTPTSLAGVDAVDDRLRLVVDLGHSAAELVVARGDQVVYARRRVAVATAPLVDRTAQAMSVQRASAETLLEDWGCGDAADPFSLQVAELCEPWLQAIRFEVERTLDYLAHRLHDGEVDRVVLCGGGAMVRGASRRLEQRLAMPVAPARCLSQFVWNAAEPYSPLYAQALAVLTGEGQP